MCVAACLGGPRGIPWSQLSGYMCVAACLGGPRGIPWSQLSGIGVLGEGDEEEEDEKRRRWEDLHKI